MYRSSGVALSLPSAALIFSLGTAVLEPAATFTADRIATHRTAWFCSPHLQRQLFSPRTHFLSPPPHLPQTVWLRIALLGFATLPFLWRCPFSS